jgi:hypothetical protein
MDLDILFIKFQHVILFYLSIGWKFTFLIIRPSYQKQEGR